MPPRRVRDLFSASLRTMKKPKPLSGLERTGNTGGLFEERRICMISSNGQSGTAGKLFGGHFIMYFDAIAKIVSQRTGCDISAVKPESKFSELGIDSLDTVELLMNLEDEIGIEIELDQKVETIDDLDKFIQSKRG